jgi:hypothetical protein
VGRTDQDGEPVKSSEDEGDEEESTVDVTEEQGAAESRLMTAIAVSNMLYLYF